MEAKRALDQQEDHAQFRYGDNGTLRLVDSYKHLGTLHDRYLCRILEMVRRAKAARTVITAISKRILRNTLLPLSVRGQAALACLVKLNVSKSVDMDQSATAVDPSDVRREQLDGEDIEYQCDECSRALTTNGSLTTHQAHRHGRVDWTRRYVASTSCPVLW